MTERSINSPIPGPVAFELELAIGAVHIDCGPHNTRARIALKTAATSGPSADAIRDATVENDNRRLAVRIADDSIGGGVVINGNTVSMNGMTVIQAGGSMHIASGGRVFVNGVEVAGSGDQSSAPTRVEVWAYLPAGSSANVKTKSGDTYTSGHLDQLGYSSSSGSLNAASVRDLDASVSSGSVRVADITGSMMVNASSGSIRVARFSGSGSSVVSASSGSIHVDATPESSGRLKASASSGSIRLTGVAHLDVRHNVSSGSVRIS